MMFFGPQAPKARDIRAAFTTIPKAMGMIWKSSRWSTIGMAIVTLFTAVIPASQAWVGKLIVDAVVQSLTTKQPVETGLWSVLPYLLFEFVLITASAVLNEVRTLLQRILVTRLKNTMNTAIISK